MTKENQICVNCGMSKDYHIDRYICKQFKPKENKGCGKIIVVYDEMYKCGERCLGSPEIRILCTECQAKENSNQDFEHNLLLPEINLKDFPITTFQNYVLITNVFYIVFCDVIDVGLKHFLKYFPFLDYWQTIVYSSP